MDDFETQVAVLRRDPLKHAVILKYLLATPGAKLHQIVQGDASASLLLLDPKQSSYDRRAYPEATASVLIASDDPALTRELMQFVRGGQRTFFRLSTDADRAIVAESFALERRNAFLSFTGVGLHENEAPADIAADVATAPYDLFAQQDHDRDWIAGLLTTGRAFTSTVCEHGTAVGACFAFELDTAIWEVGGVYCLPEYRGRGHARRAVQSALTELHRRGLISRYQVGEANIPSVRLAQSLRMTHFLTLTHYMSG
ncbi:MAG: GNAT family N-acetyltransferase [Devosia sp.]